MSNFAHAKRKHNTNFIFTNSQSRPYLAKPMPKTETRPSTKFQDKSSQYGKWLTESYYINYTLLLNDDLQSSNLHLQLQSWNFHRDTPVTITLPHLHMYK